MTVVDTSGLLNGTVNQPRVVTTVATVEHETLAPRVLNGKRIFYNAADTRMSRDGYISCASCHLDGGSDQMVWDFTQLGEGLRNTIDLTGRRGTNDGYVHWTANFDEIQDFEHDIRQGFGGAGFMPDSEFEVGTRDDPLGDRKAGISADLDDLAAYVASLTDFPDSPHRSADGALTAAGRAGRGSLRAQGLWKLPRRARLHRRPDPRRGHSHVLIGIGTRGKSGRRRPEHADVEGSVVQRAVSASRRRGNPGRGAREPHPHGRRAQRPGTGRSRGLPAADRRPRDQLTLPAAPPARCEAGVRQIRNRPAFAGAAVTILALGVGRHDRRVHARRSDAVPGPERADRWRPERPR